MENIKNEAEARLELINEMIASAKKNFQYKGFYLLLWGWVVMLASAGHYVLLQFTDYSRPWAAWWLIVAGIVASAVYGVKTTKRETSPRTLVDRMFVWIWMGFLVCYGTFVFFGAELNYEIPALTFILAAFAVFLSGALLRFRPLMWGAAVLWAGGTAMFLLPMDMQLLLTVVIIGLGYLIPGYQLQKAAKKENHV